MGDAFVGRGLELSMLETCLADARVGSGRLAWISGEAGIGKTRLAEELCARANAFVTWGRSWEGDGTPAHWPWIQALRGLAEDATLRPLIEPHLDALGGAAAHSADAERDRFRLFDAIATLIRDISRLQPVLFVLDDLHSADRASLSLLKFVARGLRGSRALIVATARDTEHEEVAAVAREALHVPLGRLDREDVERWLRERAPRFAADLDAIFATSEGNPLFVSELLIAATKRGGIATTPGIRGAIRAHLALASPTTRAALEDAAVFGREFPASALAGGLEEALQLGILTMAGERVRFSHVLLRDELEAALDPARRRQQHSVAAAWFEREGSRIAAAHHRLLAEDAAGPWIFDAMREASARLAFDDAAELGQRALSHFHGVEQCELLIAIAEARGHAGDVGACRELAARAVELAPTPELFGRAALVFAAEHLLARDDDAIAMLRRALAVVPDEDSALRAELLARMSLALIPSIPHEGGEAIALRNRAIAMARGVGAKAALFSALRCALTSGAQDVTAEERLRMHQEVAALGLELGMTARLASIAGLSVVAHIDVGDRAGADLALAAARKLLLSFPQQHVRVRAPLITSMMEGLQGNFDRALELAREALRTSEEHQVFEGLLYVAVNRAGIHFVRGDAEGFDEFASLIERLMAAPGGEAFQSLSHAVAGRIDDARRALSSVNAEFLERMPYAASLGWVVLWCDLRELAPLFYEATLRRLPFTPWLFGPGAVVTFGPTELVAARLASMLGRRDDAERHYRRALDLATRLGALPFVAQIERGLAAPSKRAPLELLRTGDHWTLGSIALRDGKGFGYLDALLRAPHRDIHCLELIGAEEDSDAGPLLDERAKRAYRERADALRDDLEEATRNADRGRAERARAELEALGDELSRAVGLGGRDRRAGSVAERARINVQRRLRDAIKKIAQHDATLGRHLELSIRTGVFCVYSPTWPD